MNRIKHFLSLLLALLLCLTSAAVPAQADTQTDDYNLITLTLSGITIDEPSLYSGTLPIDLKLSIGMDGTTLDTLRGLIELDAGFDGEDLLYLVAALEDNELKLHLDGISQDVSIPMNQALETVLSEVFLYGEPLSEAPAEFFEAFGDLLNEVNELLSGSLMNQTAETPSHYHYSEEDWRSFFVEYPARMRAVPAGEEEITFEGKTYTARKYTYDIDRLTEAEYDEYREGLIITNEEYRTSTAATEGLEDALNRMYEIGYAVKYPEESAEEDAPEDDGTRYSEEGVFYLIDEVMGKLETGSQTAHYADGTEYTIGIEQMSYMTNTNLVMETITTTATGSSRESNTVSIGEDGTFTVVSTTQITDTSDYDGYTYSYTADLTSTEIISDTKMIMDEESVYTYTYSADGETDTQNETSKTHSEMNVLSDNTANVSVRVDSSYNYGGETTASHMSMDFMLEAGILSEDTLLRVSGKPFNPLEAAENELTAYGDELYQWLMNIVNSVIPAIETPSSVGGTLLG